MNIRILCLFVFLTSVSCAGKRQASQLVEHQKTISHLAQSEMSSIEKFDSMALSFTSMMHEGLRIVNPKKGSKYVQSYVKSNEEDILNIITEYANYHSSLSAGEKIGRVLQISTSSYAKDMIQILPKFIKKYQQYRAVAKISKKLKEELFDFGLDSIQFK